MYFNNAVIRSIVLSTEHGLGTVTSVQDSGKHGKMMSVVFGRPQHNSFQRNYDVHGREIVAGMPTTEIQTLFYADDDDMVESQYRLKVKAPIPVPRWSDTLYVSRMLYDLVEGWGHVVEMEERTGAFTLEFSGLNRVTPKRLTYRHSGHRFGTANKHKPRSVFTDAEIRSGEMAAAITGGLKSENAPAWVKADPMFLRNSRMGEHKDDKKKNYVFFYKPAGSSGFLQNIMVGTGSGLTLEAAVEELYKAETYSGTTRGDKLDDLIKQFGVGHLFAYEITHVPTELKERFKAIDRTTEAMLKDGKHGRITMRAANKTA